MSYFQMLAAVFFALFSSLANVSFAQDSCDPAALSVATTPVPEQRPDTLKAALKKIAEIPSDKSITTVLVGDSIMADWDTAEVDLPGQKVWNYGLGADRVSNVIWRLQQLGLFYLKPKNVIMTIGTNDISVSGMTDCSIAAGADAIISRIERLWPEAEIYLLNVTPRGADFKEKDALRVSVNMAYAKLAEQHRHVRFVQIDDKTITCGEYSKPALPENAMICVPDSVYKCGNYKPDNLHFEHAGYKIFAEELQKAGLE